LKQEADDPSIFFERFIDYFDRYANDSYTSLLYATMIYYSKRNDRIKEGFDRLREYTVRLLEDNLEEGKRKGIFKQDTDSATYAQMFFSLMSGMNIHSPSSFGAVSRQFLVSCMDRISLGSISPASRILSSNSFLEAKC